MAYVNKVQELLCCKRSIGWRKTKEKGWIKR